MQVGTILAFLPTPSPTLPPPPQKKKNLSEKGTARVGLRMEGVHELKKGSEQLSEKTTIEVRFVLICQES